MDPIVASLNFYFALGGILLLLGAVIISVDLFFSRSLLPHITGWGLPLAFLLTIVGSAMTLVYSEVFGFIPCGLCWLQRVFLYPQVLLLGTGLYVKDTRAALYGLVLSVPGALVALYQHYLQMGGNELIGCPTAGAGADCAKRILFEFGFMTFPLLSAALFLFLIALYLYILRTQNAGA